MTIEPDASVLMKVDPLPAYTFVEGRILFPAAALGKAPLAPEPSCRRPSPRRRSSPTRPTGLVLRELKVACGACSGSASRWRARTRPVPLLPLRTRAQDRFQAQYLRDFPDPRLPPALAAFIWRMGSVGSDDVTATLLDLVNRKVIDLERVTVQEHGLFGAKDKTASSSRCTTSVSRSCSSSSSGSVDFLFHGIATATN